MFQAYSQCKNSDEIKICQQQWIQEKSLKEKKSSNFHGIYLYFDMYIFKDDIMNLDMELDYYNPNRSFSFPLSNSESKSESNSNSDSEFETKSESDSEPEPELFNF